MKIAITIQPISMIGGIRTHALHLKQGMLDCGVECDIISLSKSGTAGKNDSIYDLFLGYNTNKLVELKSTLSKYDAVIHQVVPHKNKSFKETDWQETFIENTKNIVIYHDTLAYSYAWISDLGGKIWAHIGVQEKTKYSFQFLNYEDYNIIYHPIDTNIKFNTSNRLNFAMAPHQWKSWKRMDKIVEATIYQKNPTFTYNTGIICRYMRSEMGKYKDLHNIWLASMESGNHEYCNFVEENVLKEHFLSSKVIIDISRGELGSKTLLPNLNYSILEGMLYGLMPVISFHEYDFKDFPKDNNYIIDENNIVDSIASNVDKAILEYDSIQSQNILKLNREFVINNFDRANIAKQYIDIINGKQKKIMNKIDFNGRYKNI